MNMDIKVFPGGATVWSTTEGIVHSRIGWLEGLPYLGIVVGTFDRILVGADVNRPR